jgi:hypothetical protein
MTLSRRSFLAFLGAVPAAGLFVHVADIPTSDLIEITPESYAVDPHHYVTTASLIEGPCWITSLQVFGNGSGDVSGVVKLIRDSGAVVGWWAVHERSNFVWDSPPGAEFYVPVGKSVTVYNALGTLTTAVFCRRMQQ